MMRGGQTLFGFAKRCLFVIPLGTLFMVYNWYIFGVPNEKV